MKKVLSIFVIMFVLIAFASVNVAAKSDLWNAYNKYFKNAKYVDLTHSFNGTIPVWYGFGNSVVKAGVAGQDVPGYVKKGTEFTYKTHGFQITRYYLCTDQLGTQLDPPAHFYQYGATISDLPATYAIRPLIVIDTHKKVVKKPDYHCTVQDIKAWEAKYGPIPEGSVVMIRSDWSKKWNNVKEFNTSKFPGIKLDALKYLHLKRKILFHGHEPLDTDTTPKLDGEVWLLHNNFCQAEGVANLDKVPEAGALIAIGFAKPEGGTGGYARYIAICPSDWKYGTSVIETPGAPLPKQPYPLKRDKNGILKPTPPNK